MAKPIVKISGGNTKVGKIPNISLPPIETCRKGLPCYQKCYAMKSWKRFHGTRKAWSDNLRIYKADPKGYFQQIDEYLTRKSPTMFRWHVGGDIPDYDYLFHMIELARRHPHINFLAFTKRFEYSYFNLVDAPNLVVVLSMWPGMKDAPRHNNYGFYMPRAWCQDGTEERMPEDAILCGGSCMECGMCWSLRSLEKDVVFNIH